jgi:hypothetical protein
MNNRQSLRGEKCKALLGRCIGAQAPLCLRRFSLLTCGREGVRGLVIRAREPQAETVIAIAL